MKEGLCKSIMVLSLKDMCKNSVSEHPEDHESSMKTFRCNFIESSFWMVWNISPVVACMGVVGWWIDASSPTCSK
jgi:hypothetical protein